MDNLDEGDILPNPEEAIAYENTMVYNEGEEIIVPEEVSYWLFQDHGVVNISTQTLQQKINCVDHLNR